MAKSGDALKTEEGDVTFDIVLRSAGDMIKRRYTGSPNDKKIFTNESG